ncbi:hypothetical protein SI65_08508 [Aspergillus cristatus]|uniref:Uncharacterized protein n=1 Tax=Aspergillus cristatus TaxID=573508 RepID=A0A1E3B582_ASPCR|nr:hypothetical protein SI65_08508 [Aspergillus cristatus]
MPRGMNAIRQFVREYTSISRRVIAKGQITESMQTQWFFDGLPIEIRKKIVKEGKFDSEVPSSMNFERARALTVKYVDDSERTYRTMNPERDQPEVNRLVREYGRDGHDFAEPKEQRLDRQPLKEPLQDSHVLGTLDKTNRDLALAMQKFQSGLCNLGLNKQLFPFSVARSEGERQSIAPYHSKFRPAYRH